VLTQDKKWGIRAAVVLPLLGDGGDPARRLDHAALGEVYPGAGEAAFRSSLMPWTRLPGTWVGAAA